MTMQVINHCPQCGKHESLDIDSPEALLALDNGCIILCHTCADIKGAESECQERD